MTVRNWALVGAVLAIALGFGLKVERYADRFADHAARDQARVARVLAADGWVRVPNASAPLPFDYGTFAKSGCAAKLTVAALGSSRELVDEVRLAFGLDVRFHETASPIGLLAWSPAGGSPPCQAPEVSRWSQVSGATTDNQK